MRFSRDAGAVILVAFATLAGLCGTPSSTANAGVTAKAPDVAGSPTQRPIVPAAPDGAKPMSVVPDLVAGGACPDPGPARAADIASAAAARIPLRVGLTLTHTWKANADDYEHECLVQVADINARGFVTKISCPIGPQHELKHWTRRTCWTDVFDSHLYITGTADKYPDTFVGALEINLSLASFAALTAKHDAPHRYLGINDRDPRFIDADIDGVLKSDGAGTFAILINDRQVEVPTLEASYVGRRDIIRVKVLNDARFPLMLDYYIPTMDKFFITYTKVSFPTTNELEQHLAVEKRADVYGIYFDFARDSLRAESEPVLHEIAEAMKAHPDWTLVINGHTDNIGGDAMNLDLSRRRARTVRNALMEQWKIDGARLSTNGFGASQPKESNDTERGRARNRRVELVRQN
jgi:flagellar motor protein MotB